MTAGRTANRCGLSAKRRGGLASATAVTAKIVASRPSAESAIVMVRLAIKTRPRRSSRPRAPRAEDGREDHVPEDQWHEDGRPHHARAPPLLQERRHPSGQGLAI